MSRRSSSSYPSTRRLARELLLTQARVRLSDYVAAVACGLRDTGASAVEQIVPERAYLEANLRVRVAPSWLGHHDTSNHDVTNGQLEASWVELEWAEDSGWSLTHPSFAAGLSAWRFLHSALVPAPASVAAFVRETLASPDSASPYPARFRHRSQPLRVVVEQLGEHQPDPSTPPSDERTKLTHLFSGGPHAAYPPTLSPSLAHDVASPQCWPSTPPGYIGCIAVPTATTAYPLPSAAPTGAARGRAHAEAMHRARSPRDGDLSDIHRSGQLPCPPRHLGRRPGPPGRGGVHWPAADDRLETPETGRTPMCREFTALMPPHDQPARLVIAGDIDTAHAHQQLDRALREALCRHRHVVVDLTGVHALSDTATHILSRHRDRLSAVLVALHSPPSQLLRQQQPQLPLAHQPLSSRRGGGLPRPRPLRHPHTTMTTHRPRRHPDQRTPEPTRHPASPPTTSSTASGPERSDQELTA